MIAKYIVALNYIVKDKCSQLHWLTQKRADQPSTHHKSHFLKAHVTTSLSQSKITVCDLRVKFITKSESRHTGITREFSDIKMRQDYFKSLLTQTILDMLYIQKQVSTRTEEVNEWKLFNITQYLTAIKIKYTSRPRTAFEE